MFRRILVANDGSTGSHKAVHKALEVAKWSGAELHEISVEEPLPRYVEEMFPDESAPMGRVLDTKRDMVDYLNRVAVATERLAAHHGMQITSHVVRGHTVETIVTFVKERAVDLLVIGFMGHSRLFGYHWGGTSQDLTRLVPCDVLVVK